MKNEVKKKMTMQEHEVAVPKSLHDNFCKRNIQSSDAQSFLMRIFFLTMIMNVEDAFAPESPDHDGRVRLPSAAPLPAEASILSFTHL